MRENEFVCCLIGRGKNFYVRPRHFPLEPTQNLSLQNGEKTEQGEFDGEMTKFPMCTPHG